MPKPKKRRRRSPKRPANKNHTMARYKQNRPKEKCPGCGKEAIYHKTSKIVYGGRDFGAVWTCPDYPKCDHYVGALHDGQPKGSLAGPELREWRKQAHATFDPQWRNGKMSRGQAYKALQELIGKPQEETHIGMFNKEECQKVIAHFKEN